MEEILNNFYHIYGKKVMIDGKQGYQDREYIYIIISTHNNKAIHREQATVAYHLQAHGYPQTAVIIPNQRNEWLTKKKGKTFIVLKVQPMQEKPLQPHAEALARFHQSNMAYPYEPRQLSNYGQWKDLWIDKLTFYEDYIIKESEEHKNAFFRLLRDVLPYMIGLSENAIQYVQESDRERDFDVNDQGTIAFFRYERQLKRKVIWMNDLLFDHRVRDVAEFIREQMLTNDSLASTIDFLDEYETSMPLSAFSRRLLYARLLFPIHFYDFLDDVFTAESYERNTATLEKLLVKQERYEQRFKRLFNHLLKEREQKQIPLIEWLT